MANIHQKKQSRFGTGKARYLSRKAYAILQALADAEQSGYPFVVIEMNHTLCLTLKVKDLILPHHGLHEGEQIAYRITPRGKTALRQWQRRELRPVTDGLCCQCRLHPRHQQPNGRLLPYCQACSRDYAAKYYHLTDGKCRTPRRKRCADCGKRPRARTAKGRYYSYCVECRKVRQTVWRNRWRGKMKQKELE